MEFAPVYEAQREQLIKSAFNGVFTKAIVESEHISGSYPHKYADTSVIFA